MKPTSGKKSALDNTGQGSKPASLRVLYDGWPLAYAPNSAAAMHLLALLAALPEEVEARVAIPGPTPHTLPPRADLLRQPAENSPAARLNWEQRSLPALAEQQAAILHLGGLHAPLACKMPVAASPIEAETAGESRPHGLAARLRQALVFGAAGGIDALLWPRDLPETGENEHVFLLPPLAHPAFWGPPAWDSRLPDTYILYLGALRAPALELLVEGWKWAGPAVGENFPLLLPGLNGAQQAALSELAAGWELDETLRLLPAGTLAERAALVGQASAVVCLDEPPAWGDPILEALAAGKPLIAQESESTSARVGPAAYLVPARDARALGAALTTLVVEEEVAENLSRAARQRAEGWHSQHFGRKLAEAYRRILRM